MDLPCLCMGRYGDCTLPILLRALPLSFQTMWRYTLLLPVLAIITIVFAIISAFIPIANWLVLPTMAVLATLTGLRCAVVAKGFRKETDFGRLLDSSIKFCLLGMVFTFAANLLFSGAVWLIEPFTDRIVADPGAGGGAETTLKVPTAAFYVLLAVRLALPIAYAAAIAVPMAAAAATSNTTGRQPDLIWGLGAGAFSIAVPLIVWGLVGHFFAFFGEVWTMFLLVASAAYSLVMGSDFYWSISLSPLSLMGATVLMTWASSWFFATAVLAFEREIDRTAARRVRKSAAEAEARKSGASDIRALREARTRRKAI